MLNRDISPMTNCFVHYHKHPLGVISYQLPVTDRSAIVGSKSWELGTGIGLKYVYYVIKEELFKNNILCLAPVELGDALCGKCNNIFILRCIMVWVCQSVRRSKLAFGGYMYELRDGSLDLRQTFL